jgi:cytochrome c biogenesis protein
VVATIRKFLIYVWDTIASLKVAIILFILIIAASMAGTLTSYDVYHAGWFAALLSLFGVNLLACTAQRIARKKARVGSLISHVGILVILIGVIVGAVSGQEGHIAISEGETLGSYQTDSGNRNLPFQIRLDDFEVRWNDKTAHQLHVNIVDSGVSKSIAVQPGKTYAVEGTDYTLDISRYVPDLYVDENRQVASRSENPANPALLVIIKRGEATENRWVFANHPDLKMSGDDNIAMKYRFERKAVDFKSTITLLDDGQKPATHVLEVNHPLTHKGYSLYQAHFDPDRLQWTGFDVVRDPGVNVVFAGILLLNAGVFLALYRRSKKSQTP